ncbi:exosome complex component RRP46 [Monomorium pharaonis]|uniref:exosome complex component RRP46 n=1 Tax=Monomorium pharaonis TaxID=307658 RepID=UPI00063EF3A5|nr:exosome complex component RRP46 [Monomorium pharaonis]XP_012525002.1 exosome complex component RRP46 [Monomorium pharaonis]XP_012525003.1 exosome complex component RRP46 [Monomorium pharaonis]XP_028048231.1 exosome complex component RRP46 [Monomorium pharaonis]XP_036145680.1 exosome complex component RRP46 [Monomorium pharaonis]
MTENATEVDCILRPMNCEISLLSRSDGSTMFMQGDTTIIAGVNGPLETKSQKMAYDRVSIEVTYTPLKGPAKVDDRLIETYIKETCESAVLISFHPNTMVCINLQEMQDSGGLLACAINASCLALINSGLSMKFTIAAVSCMIQKETGELIMDPDNSQLKNAKAEFTYAFDSINNDIICCHSVGQFSQSEFLASMDKCRQVSKYVFDYYREVTKKYANII